MAESSSYSTAYSSSLEVTSTVNGARAADFDPYENWLHTISNNGYMAVAILLGVVWVFGTLFNVTGLAVFFKNKQLRSPTNIFVMCLLLNDLLMSFFPTFLVVISAVNKRWLFGRIGCLIEGFTVYFLGLSSMYILAAISIDRYIIIAKPLLGPQITHKVAITGVAVCWCLGFLWSAFPLIGWNEYVLEGAGISCSVVWESSNPSYTSYIFVIFFTCLVIPVSIMVFAYFNVFMTIRNMSRNHKFDQNSRVAKRNMRVEKKMAKTIALMMSAFLFCWMPYAIFSFNVVFQGSESVSPELATYPAILAKSQGLLNPVLYVATNKQFREAFYQMLPCTGLRESLIKREQDKPESDDESDAEGGASKSTTKPKQDKNKKQKCSKNAVRPAAEATVQDDGETIIEVLPAEPSKAQENGVNEEEIAVVELTGGNEETAA